MTEKLAIDGGIPAKTTPDIHMYPGGLEIGEEEKKEVLEVIDNKYLFRYYGPEDVPSKVGQFEKEFSQKVGSKHALAVNSCTSALISALVACGVGPGGRVVTFALRSEVLSGLRKKAVQAGCSGQLDVRHAPECIAVANDLAEKVDYMFSMDVMQRIADLHNFFSDVYRMLRPAASLFMVRDMFSER